MDLFGCGSLRFCVPQSRSLSCFSKSFCLIFISNVDV